MSDQLASEAVIQKHTATQEKNVHAFSRIRNHNPTNLADAHIRLSAHGFRDRPVLELPFQNFSSRPSFQFIRKKLLTKYKVTYENSIDCWTKLFFSHNKRRKLSYSVNVWGSHIIMKYCLTGSENNIPTTVLCYCCAKFGRTKFSERLRSKLLFCKFRLRR